MEDILIRGKYDDVDGKKTSLPKQQQNIADFMKRLWLEDLRVAHILFKP